MIHTISLKVYLLVTGKVWTVVQLTSVLLNYRYGYNGARTKSCKKKKNRGRVLIQDNQGHVLPPPSPQIPFEMQEEILKIKYTATIKSWKT